MEQRLAEFREARKRAGLVAQPSTSSQSVQVSGAKAEPAAATPKTATGWLRRFLRWKAGPLTAQAQPNQPQVRRREACTLKLRLRVGPRPAPHKPHPRLLALRPFPVLCALSLPLPSGWTTHFLSVCQHMIRGLGIFRPSCSPVRQLVENRKRRSRELEERRNISALQWCTAN